MALVGRTSVCWGFFSNLLEGQLPNNGARGRTVAADNLQRQADRFILARIHVLQVEAFDNPDTRLEQDAMGLRAGILETAYRKIIHAHGLHTAPGQVASGLGLNENILLLEVIRLPAAPGIAGLEQHALAICQVMRLQLRGPDHFRIGDLDHARPSDASGDWHAFHSCGARQIVARSVHMGADVSGGRNLRQVALLAMRDLERTASFERRIAGPANHAVPKRHGNVDPLAGHDATATTFFTPPGWFFNASSARSSGKRPVIRERKLPGQLW